MSRLDHKVYTENPSDYLLCSDPDNQTDVTCVIVEDNPGPYLDFVQDIVQSGICSMAMTAPFTDITLQLLRGQPATFGNGSDRTTVALANPAHCVLILDMRNGDSESTVQSFAGYDANRFELAGYQFFKQLRGFPGKVFFATRYGRDLLEEMGVTGAFGVVPLNLKSDYHGPMQESDKQKLLAALDLVLLPIDPSGVYRMTRRGDVIVMTSGGEIASIMPGKEGPSKPAIAFMEVVKAGPVGLTGEELARRIDYKPRDRKPAHAGDSEVDNEDCGPDMTADDLLPKLIQLVRDGRIDGVKYIDLVEHLGTGAGSSDGDSEEIIREVFAFCQEMNADFTQEDFIDLLRSGPIPSKHEDKLDVTDWETMSVFGENGSSEVITPHDKARCIRCYVDLHYKEIPRRQAEIADAEAALLKMRADGLRCVVKSAEADNRQEAIARKKALGEPGVEHRHVRELKEQVIRLGHIRDEYYRIGIKSVPVKSETNEVIGFRVAAPASKVADAMRQLKKRLISSLNQCRPVPEALIEHISTHWVRDKCMHRYTGKFDWHVD